MGQLHPLPALALGETRVTGSRLSQCTALWGQAVSCWPSQGPPPPPGPGNSQACASEAAVRHLLLQLKAPRPVSCGF